MNGEFTVHDIEIESGEETSDKAVFNEGNLDEIKLHVPKLEDIGHPLVPSVEDEYVPREINGVMDLELISFFINDPDFFAMIEGEAGTGKNLCLDTICHLARWPRIRMNFGLGTTYENLVGRYAPNEDADPEAVEDILQAIDETESRQEKLNIIEEHELRDNANFRWVDGLLTKAVKYGWVFVADEINAAEEEAIMPLNGLTEGANSRYLTIEEKSEVIKPHPRFRFVATRNPIDYAGVSEMNAALQSRAFVVTFDYHNDDGLMEIIQNNTDLVEREGEATTENFIDLVQDIRRQEQAGSEILTKISSRDVIKVARLTEIMPIKEACRTILLSIADPTDEHAIREMIRTQNL